MKKLLFPFITAIGLLLASCSKSDTESLNLVAAPNNRPVGSSAKDFLRATDFQSIKLEIVYMPGFAPDDAALTNLINFLNALLNKPGGIQVTERAIAASGRDILSLKNVNELEDANRTVFNNGSSLGVFLMFTDTEYSDENILGVSYRNTSMVVFGKKVHDNSGGINQSTLTRLETTVEEHEFGHLLGLVDLGSTMQTSHVDTQHGKHCINKSCLMYYGTQVDMAGGIIISGPVPALDDNCRNDLRANGGK